MAAGRAPRLRQPARPKDLQAFGLAEFIVSVGTATGPRAVAQITVYGLTLPAIGVFVTEGAPPGSVFLYVFRTGTEFDACAVSNHGRWPVNPMIGPKQ